MGRRSHGETVVRILSAFARKLVWSQAELARECGVTPRALRARMVELAEAHVPVSREFDAPHVYWSISPGYFPGGRFVRDSAIIQITRALQCQPSTPEQQRALALLGATEPGPEPSDCC